MKILQVGIGTLVLFCTSMVQAIDTSFTYQGELQFMGAEAEGSFDFEFELYDGDEDTLEAFLLTK